MAIKHTTIDIDWKIDDGGLRTAERSVKSLDSATKSATSASASFTASQKSSAVAQRESTSATRDNTQAQQRQQQRDEESTSAKAKLREEAERYENELKSSRKSLELSQKADASYTEMLKAQGHAHAANSDHIRSLKQSYVSLQSQYGKEVSQLHLVNQASGAASKEYQAQRKHVNDLGLQIAQTSAKLNGFNRAQKSMKSVSKSANAVYDKTKALSLGVGAAFVYGAKKAIELQHEYKVTNNLLTTGGEAVRTSLKATKQMQSDGAKYSIQYGKSQKSIAEGYQELTKRGYTSAQSLGSMQSLLKASVASGDSFSDVVHDSTSALESFGMRAKTTAGMVKNTKTVTNQMAYAADLTATDFHSMGLALSYSGVSAKQAGLSLSETSSAIGILSNNGLEADKAGTGLRKTLTSLQSPSKTAQEAMAKIGLSTKDFVKSNGDMKSMADTFGLIQKHSAKLGATEKASVFHNLFGATGQQAGAILADNANQLGKLNQKVKDSAKNDYTGSLSAKNMETAQNQVNKFKQAASGLAITFAQTVLPSITKLAVGMGGLLEKFGSLDKSQKTMITWTAITVAALAPAAKIVSVVTTLGSAAIKTAGFISKLATSEKVLSSASATLGSTETATSAATGAVGVGGKLAKGKSALMSLGKAGLVAGGISIIADKLPSAIAGQSKGMSEAARGENSKGGIGTDEWIGNKVGSAWNYMTGKDVPTSAKRSSDKSSTSDKQPTPFDSLPKDARSATQTATKLVSSANKDWAKASADMSMKQTKRITADQNVMLSSTSSKYSKAYSALSGYVTKASAKSNQAASFLEKIGATSSKSAQEALNSQNSYNSKHLAKVKADYAAIERDERSGGANRVQLVQKLNADIARLTDKGNKKQLSLAKDLDSQTTKLSASQFKSIKSQSDKAYSLTKSAAKKTYKADVSAAESRYNQTVKAAKQLYGVHSAEYKKIKGYAEDQYIGTTNKARDQYQGTLKWAKKQHTDVVAEAKAEAKDAADAWSSSAASVINSIPTLVAQNKKDGIFASQPTKTKKYGLDKSLAKQSNPLGTPKTTSNNLGKGSVFSKAAGGAIRKSGMAMVGENGSEVLQRGKQFSVVGARGAQLLQVRSGDRIYNHTDVAKMSHGSFSQRLPNFADGTASLPSFSSGSGSALPGISKKTSKDSISESKKMSKSVTKNYGDMSKKSASSLKQLSKKNASLWHDTRVDTESETTKLHKQTTSKITDTKDDSISTLKSMHKQFNNVTTDLVSDFGSIFGKLKGQAHDGMAGAIKSMNGGISSIDTTLAQFGGNKSVLKPIHYAMGSKGPIANDQLAVLNDAKSGPRQELVSRGSQLLKPIGDDVTVPLKKGDEVFNGSQVERAKPYLPHFAKGTGASDSKLISLASKNQKKPDSAWQNDFDSKIKSSGTDLQRGVTSAVKGAADSVGPNWYKAGWNVINDAINGNGAGGNWAHSPGLRETNSFSAKRGSGVHDGVDFSGAIGSPFRAVHGGTVVHTGPDTHWHDFKDLGNIIEVHSDDGYQEIYQEFGGAKNIKVHAGDQIKTGQAIGTLGHLAGHDVHVHVGVSKGSLWNHGGYSHNGWFDVTKMHGSTSGASKSKSKDTGVEKLFKQELGKSALSWIGKHLQTDSAGGSMGNPSGSSVSRWRGAVRKALEANHISATEDRVNNMLAMIKRESGGNPKAVQPGKDPDGDGSGPALGLGQTKRGTFNANKLSGHNNIFNGYDNLLAATHYIKGKYGTSSAAFSRVAARGYATGGRPKVGEWSIVGEKGPELFKPDSAGTVFPNDKSQQIVNKSISTTSRSGKPKIDFHPTINVNIKSGANGTVNKQQVMKWVKEALGDSFEQLQDLLGGA